MSSKTKTTATKEEAKPALVPKLRFPEFRRAGEWSIEEVSDLLDESRTPSLQNDPSRRITVRLHLLGVEHREHRGTESTESTNNFRRKAGQFIYGKQNIHKGAFGIIPSHLDGFETSQDIPCFDFKGRCYPLWLYYHFASESVYGPLELKMTGTGSKRLNEKTFLSLPIAVPPYSEQQKIAECLSSVDELMATQAQKVDALKVHKKGLMQQLFPREGETQPRLRFPEFDNAGEWVSDSLGNIFETTSGGTPSRTEKAYWNGDIPWITTSLVDFRVITSAEEFLTDEGLRNSSAKLFPKGTVLMAMYGQGKTRGQVALLGIKAATNQACAAILPRKGIDPYFVFLNLAGRYEEIREISNSGGQENLSQGLIREIRFAFPPDDDEQHKVTACLSSLDALITAETKRLEALKTHKKGLMQQLFPSSDEVEA